MCCICTPVCFLSVFQKFQDIEESHIVHMKDIIQSYTQSVDETHVQIGEVSRHTHIPVGGVGRVSCPSAQWVHWVSDELV